MKPSSPETTDATPLWTPAEVRAAVSDAIARDHGWIAAWGVSWLVRRGHEVDGAAIAWLRAHAPDAAVDDLLLALADGGEVRRQPAVARALLEWLSALEPRSMQAIDAVIALAEHLDGLDDALESFIEEGDRILVRVLLPALARSRDPRASDALFRLAQWGVDDDFRWAALIGLVRRGEVGLVAKAAPSLLADLDSDGGDSLAHEVRVAIDDGLELHPLRRRHEEFIEGIDRYGDPVPIEAAVEGLAEGCDPDTARRLAVAFPLPAARKVQRSLQAVRPEKAWDVLISCAAHAAELAAAESPRFAAEARAIGSLVAALGERGFPAGASVEEQMLLDQTLALLIAHCARAHRIDGELTDPAVEADEARALLLVDQPWNAPETFELARMLLSTADLSSLYDRKSFFSRRNMVILRAIDEPDRGVRSLLDLDALENWDPPLRAALRTAAPCFRADALPALARLDEESPDADLLAVYLETAARLGTIGAREAVRAQSAGDGPQKEFFSEMVFLAMDLRDGERARAIVDALAADPAARLHVASVGDAVPETDEIRRALEEMVALTGASGAVDARALPAIAARTHDALVELRANAPDEIESAVASELDELDRDEIAADDDPWDPFGPDAELERAMERLAGRLPPLAARGPSTIERDARDLLGPFSGGREADACGPGCGHSHHAHPAPLRPLHAAAKVGRNDLCPCGSGKKHKRCCGK